MSEPAPTEKFSPLWHWGPLEFHGLFGYHGLHLCFHRHPDPSRPDAIVDPAKAIIPLESPVEKPLP
jgi:hypothetical protein